MKEIWKVVNDHPKYMISNSGRVMSFKTNNPKIVGTKRLSQKGYYRVGIDGRRTFVHRLVAEAFIPNPDNKPEVNHINGIKTDNNVQNLEWVTSGENQKHAYKRGLREPIRFFGELNPGAKLTNKQVEEIMEALKFGKRGIQKELAIKYNVSSSLISNIKKKKQIL